MSTTPNKNLTEAANGATGWDVTLNVNLTNIDQAFGTVQSFNLAGLGGTLIVSGSTFVGGYPANTPSYIPLIWNVTGALVSTANLLIPTGVSGHWIIYNSTSAFPLKFGTQVGGATVTVPNISTGKAAQVAVIGSTAFLC